MAATIGNIWESSCNISSVLLLLWTYPVIQMLVRVCVWVGELNSWIWHSSPFLWLEFAIELNWFAFQTAIRTISRAEKLLQSNHFGFIFEEMLLFFVNSSQMWQNRSGVGSIIMSPFGLNNPVFISTSNHDVAFFCYSIW